MGRDLHQNLLEAVGTSTGEWHQWVQGKCEIWAKNFIAKNGGEAVWIDELPGHEKLPDFIDHQVVLKGGRYYDAINPGGVKDWRKLSFVKWTLDGSIAKRCEKAAGNRSIKEGLLAESYSTGLLAFLKYLKSGIDPHDFAHEIEAFYEDRGEDPPESFDAVEPYTFLDTPEFAEVKDDFTEYLKNHVSPDSADLPTYLFLTDAKLVPRQTWLIHFSDNAYDIARNGFRFGAQDFTQLGLTTHFVDKIRKAGPGWNFAFIAGSRDAERAMHGDNGRSSTPKYGKEAVLFQSAGVQAYHSGDSEEQVIFWGPGVTERYHLEFVEGVWDISRGDGGGSLYSSEDIDDVVAWVQRNHGQYKRITANRRVEKPLTSTPKAMRDALLNRKPERIPQPFDESVAEAAKTPLTNGTPITLPTVWFHGDENFPKYQSVSSITRFAYYTGAKPDPIKKPVPQEVEDLYHAGKIKNIHHTYPSANWRVGRKYSGRSNFGFGIYLTGSLEWAQRYGDYITVATIDPSLILAGNWDDRDKPGTVMHAVMQRVKALSGDHMADQARVFYRAVKAVDRTKKALYVQTLSGEGQLVVYDPSIIHCKAVMEMNEAIKEAEDQVCPKCKAKIRPAIPHKCPTGKHWAGGGEKFKTPIKESEDDLLTIVKNLVSNEHPDDHVPEDYRWAREKAFNPQDMVHMMPGGLPAWKIWIASEAKEDPDHYKDFPAKVTTITDPVIVSPGHIWDGWHRIAAAIVNGLTSIPAIVGTHAR